MTRSGWFGLAGALVLACRGNDGAAPPAASTNAAPRVVKVRPAGDSPLWSATGRLVASPSDAALVAMPLQGRVVAVRARPGDRLRRGEPVADVLLPEALKAAAALAASSSRLSAWSRRLDQLRALETEGLARAADRVDAETRVAEAKADAQLAGATLKAASLPPEQAARLLTGDGRWRLVAPFDGVVTDVMALPGEVRDAGAPVARFERAGSLRVEARWPGRPPTDARWEVVIGDERRAVTLVASSPVSDVRDGSTAVWFSWPEDAHAAAGASGTVHRLAAEDESLFAVPTGALRRTDGRTVVFLRTGAAPAEQPVEVVAVSAAEAVVRGLKAGDELLAEAPRAAPGGAE